MDPLKLILLSLTLLAYKSQAQEEGALVWATDSPLTWEDFRAVPPEDRSVAATTVSGITYSFKTQGGPGTYTLEYEVTAFFDPGKSWYHPGLCNASTLTHEQLHFDITELYARKMRKMLRGNTFSGNVRARVRLIFSKINEELEAFQARYDRETDFSRNLEAQVRWNRKIAEQLEHPPG